MQFLFSKTPKSGAQTSIYCASEPTLEKSKDVYFQLVKLFLKRNTQMNESDFSGDEFTNGSWILESDQIPTPRFG
jgi:hypothetical protein